MGQTVEDLSNIDCCDIHQEEAGSTAPENDIKEDDIVPVALYLCFETSLVFLQLDKLIDPPS